MIDEIQDLLELKQRNKVTSPWHFLYLTYKKQDLFNPFPLLMALPILASYNFCKIPAKLIKYISE